MRTALGLILEKPPNFPRCESTMRDLLSQVDVKLSELDARISYNTFIAENELTSPEWQKLKNAHALINQGIQKTLEYIRQQNSSGYWIVSVTNNLSQANQNLQQIMQARKDIFPNALQRQKTFRMSEEFPGIAATVAPRK